MRCSDSPFKKEALISPAVDNVECWISPTPKYFIISIISSKIPHPELAFSLSVVYLFIWFVHWAVSFWRTRTCLLWLCPFGTWHRGLTHSPLLFHVSWSFTLQIAPFWMCPVCQWPFKVWLSELSWMFQQWFWQKWDKVGSTLLFL